jgi:hypothetical protein
VCLGIGRSFHASPKSANYQISAARPVALRLPGFSWWLDARGALSVRDPTPLDNHVEVELHHEWEIVEQKMFIRAVRVEASSGAVEQTAFP